MAEVLGGVLALAGLLWIFGAGAEITAGLKWLLREEDAGLVLDRLQKIGGILTAPALLFGLYVAWRRTLAAAKQAVEGHHAPRRDRER